MSRDTERDLSELLGELETTLTDLQSVVEDERGRNPPSPPRPTELLRFTDEYTIPTLISVLEATIRSLELLQGVIRVIGTDRPLRGRENSPERRLLEETVEDLRRVLTATEEPPDSAARDVLGDARALTAEIEARLEEARGGRRKDASGERERRESSRTSRRAAGRGSRRHGERRQADGRREDDRGDERRESDRGVRIPVDDGSAGEGTAGGETDGEGRADGEPGPERSADADGSVDVEAELQSIKDEVHGERPEEDDGENGESGEERAGEAGDRSDDSTDQAGR